MKLKRGCLTQKTIVTGSGEFIALKKFENFDPWTWKTRKNDEIFLGCFENIQNKTYKGYLRTINGTK